MKKLSYILSFVFILTVLVMISSCKKFDDTNKDPNRSNDMDASLLLSNVQLRFSGDLEINEKLNMCLTMPMVQHIGGIWANRYGQFYIYYRLYLSSLWEYTYRNDVVNIVDAVRKTTNDPLKTNLNAVCRIMKVYEFARLTDVYGDIPYSQAGKAYSDGIVRPSFDRQEDIYNDFFKELSEAAAQLDASKDVVSGDLFYNGNVESWRKFANSLRLRLAMRLVKVNPNKAREEAEAAYNAGVFTSNADICRMNHQDVQNIYDTDMRGNGISSAFTQSEVLPRVTNTFIDQLNNTNDPRLPHIVRYYIDIINRPFDRLDITDQLKPIIGYNGVESTEYVWDGWMNPIDIQVPGQGTITAVNNDQKAQLANFLIRRNAPFLHLTYAEVEFLLAEATVRWGLNLGGTTAEHYAKGIEAACQQLSLYPGGPSISSAEINTFIQGNLLIPGREVEMINTQLWVALLLNGSEAYANWRRTGFPVLTPALTQESTTTVIPRRFEYPILEVEQNAANVATAIADLGAGGNTWINRVWWDKP
ncbi:SusD/RagB family nutrient-binding outer membrane lipoprotein [Pseudopedobacter beijingensis]|uniref:SusD/RagB family nutrient-binding outer membrane lipoprotein n=1 Tax=Pseudopedobacter beijingensis TaxID=1207056 RepID=A0ABW4IGI5_9SPHI